MLPSVSSVVRVSRRCSVTMLPFVVTVHSVNMRETDPLSFVTTEDSDDFCETSLFSLQDDAANPIAATAMSVPAIIPVILFPFFISAFPFRSFWNTGNYSAPKLTDC